MRTSARPLEGSSAHSSHKRGDALDGEVLGSPRMGERPQRRHARLAEKRYFRYAVILLVLAGVWEAATRLFHVSHIVFPPFSAVISSFWHGITGIGSENGAFLLPTTASTLSIILQSFGISIVLALVFSGLALTSNWGRDVLGTLTAIFQPLPSIALLPLALLWFGLNDKSLLFVTVLAMLWPVTASLTVGFATLPPTLKDLGDNYELGVLSKLFRLYLPYALPNALAGLRVGWGYGWRTVVAAELVFGTTGGSGGLGWFIQNARTYLDVSGALAAILMVIIVGLITEGIFRSVQRRTTQKWGLEAA